MATAAAPAVIAALAPKTNGSSRRAVPDRHGGVGEQAPV